MSLKMKKYIAFLFIALFCINCGKKAELIKIGAILPLSGDLATYGNNAKRGIELLQDEINNKGGIQGNKIEVIFGDSKALPTTALSLAQKFIFEDKVIAIIGEVASSPLLAFSPIANQNKIVVVSPAASSPKITQAGEYIYRVWPSDVFEVNRMMEYLSEVKASEVSVLYVNNDYGLAMYSEIKDKFPSKNIEVKNAETFNQNSTDVRAQLLKLKIQHPKYLYLIGYPSEYAVIIRQIHELGIQSTIIATSSFEDPTILNLTGKAAEGVIYSSPIQTDSTNSIYNYFKKEYYAKYSQYPGLVSDYGYDALKVIIKSLEISGQADRQGIKQGIDKIRNLDGCTGIINFDKNGDIIKPAGIKTIKNGKFVWLEK